MVIEKPWFQDWAEGFEPIDWVAFWIDVFFLMELSLSVLVWLVASVPIPWHNLFTRAAKRG